MRLALELAARGRWTAHPNPAVGAVVVRDGSIVGEGYHERPGAAHAEAMAILQAGRLADGADLYVTLEPCVHEGRTPACVESIGGAGIRRVYVGALDPDEKVSGRGVSYLRDKGIEVVVGLLEDEVVAVDPAYFHHRRTGRPFVRYKVAATLDGFAAAGDGSSKWITSEAARQDAQALRAQADAVIVGVETVLADDPRLTCRLEEYSGPQPLRVVFDSRGRLSGRERVFSEEGSVMVVTTAAGVGPLSESVGGARLDFGVASASQDPPWGPDEAPRVVLLTADTQGPSGVGVRSVVEFLGSIQIVEALLEGGPTLAGSFSRGGLIDEMVVYIGPKIIGGGGVPILAGAGATSIEGAKDWAIHEVVRIGDDVRIVARPSGRA